MTINNIKIIDDLALDEIKKLNEKIIKNNKYFNNKIKIIDIAAIRLIKKLENEIIILKKINIDSNIFYLTVGYLFGLITMLILTYKG